MKVDTIERMEDGGAKIGITVEDNELTALIEGGMVAIFAKGLQFDTVVGQAQKQLVALNDMLKDRDERIKELESLQQNGYDEAAELSEALDVDAVAGLGEEQ